MKEKKQRAERKKLKQIPVVSYLCWLLAVSVLFTGVTFSRYTSRVSGDIATGITPFVASYTLDDFSSTDFVNMDYWTPVEGAEGEENQTSAGRTARTVRITVNNYNTEDVGANGLPSRYSAVDLQASVRLRLPSELADNLVLQVREVVAENNTVDRVPVTSQYILGNFIYQLNGGGGTEYTYATDGNGGRVYRTQASVTLDTRDFTDYSALAGSPDETLTVTGTIDENGGTVVAREQTSEGAESNVISVTASRETVNYAVGFRRGVTANDFQSQLFLDLQKEMLFYTIDITLPELYLATANGPQSRTFELFLTLAERVDYAAIEWQDEWNAYLAGPSAAENATVDDAKILGYHFDADAGTYAYADGIMTDRSDETVVRITNTYDYAANASVLSFQHIEPIDTDAAVYAHPAEHIYAHSGGALTEVTGDTLTGLLKGDLKNLTALFSGDYYGLCNNLADTPEEERYYISFNGLSPDPLDGGENVIYSLHESLSRKYQTQLTVLFVQRSEVAGMGTSAEGGAA